METFTITLTPRKLSTLKEVLEGVLTLFSVVNPDSMAYNVTWELLQTLNSEKE